MRRSWLGLRLFLSCTLLLALFAVEGKCCKEEESSSEEERHHEKKHHHLEECCEKRCHHEEEDCCCEKRCHHEEEDCCCEKRCHHEEDCCCEKRCHHEEEDCCCEKRCHHEEEDYCCEKRCHHKDEDCCKKKHSHGKEKSGKEKDSRTEEEDDDDDEEADKKKHPYIGIKPPTKRRPLLREFKKPRSDSEMYKSFAKEDQKRITEQAAQTSDVVPQYKKQQAIAQANQGTEGSYYKHLEDGQLEYKKAIGVMVYVHMLLGKTNCTKPEEEEEAGVEYSRAYLEEEGCQLSPELKQERRNCIFGFFIDMRTEKKAIVSKRCRIIPGI